jgi:hypothetical protein
MPIRLDDEQCLEWLRDPSISPFENNYVMRKYRKDILTEETLNNPKSFLNRVKRKCFYNTALRPKIIERIKEYQQGSPLRLHTMNDKISDTINYITPPFTPEECERWASNHTINPRTNKRIPITGKEYVELLYTALQYGLPTPPILDTVPDDKYDKKLFNTANRVIKSVLFRLEFIRQNDNLFLSHDTGSFDKRLKVASPITPRRRASREHAMRPDNSQGVSITPAAASAASAASAAASYKSLNEAERKMLRDMALERKEEKDMIAEYNRKKMLEPKKEIDKRIFASFRDFLVDLQKKVMATDSVLIKNILLNATVGAKARLTLPVGVYMNRDNRGLSAVEELLKMYDLDTTEGVIRNLIDNIFVQLLDPSFKFPADAEIACITYSNRKIYFKNAELIDKIFMELYANVDRYTFAGLKDYKNLRLYFRYMVEDVIPPVYVAKREIDMRDITSAYFTDKTHYHNKYYKMLFAATDEEPNNNMRLPEGMGLLIGKGLTKAIYDLDDPDFNPYFYSNPEDRVITDDNPLNGFTYLECKNWVSIPIINPRTFKKILIDSPIYNRLLCISYQYDTNLIPRMLTSRGYTILGALKEAIKSILSDQGKPPQSLEQLEAYIKDTERQFAKIKDARNVPKKATATAPAVTGLKWKSVGIKKPSTGVEIVNNKLIDAFGKAGTPLPFYVLFSKEDLEKFGVSGVSGGTEITKKSYVNIATYYAPVIDSKQSARSRRAARSARTAIITGTGLRLRKITNRQQIDGLVRNNIDINNKLLISRLLIKADKGVLPADVLLTGYDLASLGISVFTNKDYIKISNYYVPVVERRASDRASVSAKPNSNNVALKRRDQKYIPKKYYTVMDCLRWARQPNRDPIKPTVIIATDSDEYNLILEQALSYDHNIRPLNITAKGVKFIKDVLKVSEKYLTIAKQLKYPITKTIDISLINTKVCNAIKEIYEDTTTDDGKKYKRFKHKMIEKCEQFNKPPVICLDALKNARNHVFRAAGDEQLNIHYYQESALASILIEFESIKGRIYDEELRDIFIQDINAFTVYTYEIDDDLEEIVKDAIDAGGPRREFFTKLFEELFCDEEHLTRPFIRPKDNLGNRYYINPNFAPDDNFRKVIAAYKKNYLPYITDYTTERDYEYIYYVIGKLLAIPFYNDEIGLPQQFADYILTGFIKQPKDLDYYDILYFYLKDFNNATYFINMITSASDVKGIEDVMMSFNDTYKISRAKGKESGAAITKDNFIKFLQQQANHAITKNFITKDEDIIKSAKNMSKRYVSLFAGFSNEIRKFLYKKEATMEQLNILITTEPMTYAILEELANKMVVKIEVSTKSVEDEGYDPTDIMTAEERAAREVEMKGYITNIITQPRNGVNEPAHFLFVKKLLRFWTAFNYYNKAGNYRIFYKYGWLIDIKRLPEAHTCFNQLDIYGYPDNATAQEKEEYLYKMLATAVEEQQMELMGGAKRSKQAKQAGEAKHIKDNTKTKII